MSKAFSFCLWGGDPKYTIGAIENVRLIKKLFPEWRSIIYLDIESVPDSITSDLKKAGAELISRKAGGWHSMFWRFEAAGLPDIDTLLVRDTDSRLSLREKSGIDEWLNSDKNFHVIRDHPLHDVPILGGLWGVRGGLLADINELIGQWNIVSQYQNDQTFLRNVVWPRVVSSTFVHDTCWRRERALPMARTGLEFIGEVYTEFNKPAVPKNREQLTAYLRKHGELK